MLVVGFTSSLCSNFPTTAITPICSIYVSFPNILHQSPVTLSLFATCTSPLMITLPAVYDQQLVYLLCMTSFCLTATLYLFEFCPFTVCLVWLSVYCFFNHCSFLFCGLCTSAESTKSKSKRWFLPCFGLPGRHPSELEKMLSILGSGVQSMSEQLKLWCSRLTWLWLT